MKQKDSLKNKKYNFQNKKPPKFRPGIASVPQSLHICSGFVRKFYKAGYRPARPGIHLAVLKLFT
jgi:hypothetical protein